MLVTAEAAAKARTSLVLRVWFGRVDLEDGAADPRLLTENMFSPPQPDEMKNPKTA
jgi:hypothetical protein